MKKHYLHLSVYRCESARGRSWPLLAVRQNEISKETEKQQIGASCSRRAALGKGRRPKGRPPGRFRPGSWPPVGGVNPSSVTNAFVEALNRAELH